MEKCNLMLTFPEEGGELADTWISAQSVNVDVWKLNTDRVLNGKKGSRFSAPREDWMGTVVVAYGSNHSLPFGCQSGRLYTFEFSSKNAEVRTKADRQELIGQSFFFDSDKTATEEIHRSIRNSVPKYLKDVRSSKQ